MKIPVFNYSAINQCDVVVCMGGGPSSACYDKINKFIEENSAIVFVSNYSYEGVSRVDYTYYGNCGKFYKQLKASRSNNIIVSLDIYYHILKKRIDSLSGKNFYRIGKKDAEPAEKFGKWKMSEKGEFPYYKIAPSGIGNIACSIVARPKKLLITGMDGPELKDGMKNKIIKKRYSGSSRIYKKEKYYEKKNILERMLTLIQNKGISICCPLESPLWGINKSKFGVVSI